MTFSDFIFDGKYLSDFDMFAGKYNDSSTDSIFEGGDITFSNIKLSGSDRQRFGGSSFDTPLSFSFDIFKQNGDFIDEDEYSSIVRWMQRPDGYHWFQFDADGYEDVYFNTKFTLQPIDVIGHVGFHCTAVTDTGYAYSDEVTKKFTFDGNNYFEFQDYSDKIGVIYPDVKLTIKSAGNLSLKNASYGGTNTTTIKNCKVNDVIEIKKEQKGIIGVTNPNDFNFIFPVICNTYKNRKNKFTCNLQADIEIKYRMTRMVTV